MCLCAMLSGMLFECLNCACRYLRLCRYSSVRVVMFSIMIALSIVVVLLGYSHVRVVCAMSSWCHLFDSVMSMWCMCVWCWLVAVCGAGRWWVGLYWVLLHWVLSLYLLCGLCSLLGVCCGLGKAHPTPDS